MLYIGGYSEDKFVVVDTDDGSEQVASRREIAHCVRQLGLTIEGVRTHKEGRQVIVDSISLYRKMSPPSGITAKLKVLYGVDVILRDKKIVRINIPDELSRPVSIRLSDFATSCGDTIVGQRFRHRDAKPDIEIVLDDKISVTDLSFKHFMGDGIRLNLKDFHSLDLVNTIISEAKLNSEVDFLEQFVVDCPERIDFYKAILLVERDYSGVGHIREITNNPVQATADVTKWYLQDFRDLLTVVFRVRDKRVFTLSCDVLAKWLSNRKAVELLESRDYNAIRNSKLWHVLVESSHTIALKSKNFETVQKLQRYLYYFDPAPEVQEIFIDYCIRWRNWLRDWSIQSGWLRFWY